MTAREKPIQKQLVAMISLVTIVVLAVMCASFFIYEYVSFRRTILREVSTLSEIIAANSTAALAFEDKPGADEILSALKAEKHIVSAGLYDRSGRLFSQYPAGSPGALPEKADPTGFEFHGSFLSGFHPVDQGGKQVGYLFLKSDMGAMYETFRLYAVISILVMAGSFVIARILSRRLARKIASPILMLASTARAVVDQKDYSLRAQKSGNDEIGFLTDSFNHMLSQIEQQNAEITQFNLVLEQRVQDRTVEMERANQELESFSYSISHDLRAPLRSISGYSQILLEDYAVNMDEEGRRVCQVIVNNGKRMGQLIDDLLDFSRLGRQELQRAYVDMETLVREILKEQTAHENGRRLDIQVRPLRPGKADRHMLTQVWVNLVSNALKYSRNREVTQIEIGCMPEGSVNRYYIKDNGAGFDMQYAPKLFGVFQRLHKMNEFEGTGVGLALVKRIIERHGGEVWAESEVNQGATFYFTLPDN